ncbi:MAG: YraN family protein [Bacteroidetes bacterium]|nr:YraN family protein [Bacteroidota bacterium]
MKTEKRAFGDFGEKVARDYFLKKGYRFLASNFSYQKYEIDLIFEEVKTKTLIFIEVKTRKSDALYLPEESINAAKQQKIRKCAALYLRLNREFAGYNIRYDSFTVVKNEKEFKTNHIEYAF